MTLSMTCPECGKQFRNIKPEFAGKKVRCGCGAITRVGQTASTTSEKEKRQPKTAFEATTLPQDLLPPASLNVDLLGDEMLGDELIGGTPVKEEITKRQQRSKIDIPKRSLGKQQSAADSVVTNQEVTQPGSTKPNSISPKPTKAKKKKHRPPVPIAHPTVVEEDKPVFTSTYDDLDAILNGAGDAAPVMARTEVKPSVDNANEPAQNLAAEPEAKASSPLGFLAGLGSATLAFWFGMFVLLCRFQIIEGFLIKTLCASIRSVNAAEFEPAEMTTSFYYVFVGLGWALWVFAAALMIFAIAQFADAFVKLLLNRKLFSWADGLTAAAAISCVFVIVALVFAHSTFAKHHHRNLAEFERGSVEEGEHLPAIERLLAEFDGKASDFRLSMIGGGSVPMVIFILTMVRLFMQTYEQEEKPAQAVIY